MAGQIIKEVNNTFTSIQAATSTANNLMCTGARTTIAAALTTGSEADYPLLDFQLKVSSGTPTENGLIHVFRRSKADGTNEQEAPTTTYKPEPVATFIMANVAATTYYYAYGKDNADKNATYYMLNKDGSITLTIELLVRARSLNTV